jgi:hypothetical protein
MGRVYVHLAACAIAAASLLAGASGAVAAADPTDSAGSEHTNSTPADSDPAPSFLGASTPPRVITGGSAVRSTPQWSGDPAPRLPRASTSEPALGEQPSTNVGLTARGQNPIRTGYTSQSVRRPLAEMAAGALPGVAGMVIMTASGICLGYRQAMAGQLLQTEGAHRFLD